MSDPAADPASPPPARVVDVDRDREDVLEKRWRATIRLVGDLSPSTEQDRTPI